FFTEDLEELQEAGYLKALVPAEFGGPGLSLSELAREQMALAGAAPATALAVNMHHVWVGVAQVVPCWADTFLDGVLREAAAGELFGFGISEPGNDLVLFGSKSEAHPDDDRGYSFYGTKILTSFSPAWTRLGVFGTDTTSADGPKSV